jgi:hypothetical protein
MLIERHEPVNLFELVPLERDAVLDELDRLLDDDKLFQAVTIFLRKSSALLFVNAKAGSF